MCEFMAVVRIEHYKNIKSYRKVGKIINTGGRNTENVRAVCYT